jgi:hypothetical protein
MLGRSLAARNAMSLDRRLKYEPRLDGVSVGTTRQIVFRTCTGVIGLTGAILALQHALPF